MKEILKRMIISFSLSSFAGLIVNLVIDLIVNNVGNTGFISIAPEFVSLFPTPVIAGYVNVLIYGAIGAVFSGMTLVFDCRRIGVIIQWCIYFVVTFTFCMVITIFVWQLHRYPQAFISTAMGYAVTYVILGVVQYRQLKEDIKVINENLNLTQ
ncbi:MAG: DUF3021 family protein [Lachnospiraceae bacterium]|nr:DUF3021 family protein [Lachnospiraceae bacterium]